MDPQISEASSSVACKNTTQELGTSENENTRVGRLSKFQIYTLRTWADENLVNAHRFPSSEECTALELKIELPTERIKRWLVRYCMTHFGSSEDMKNFSDSQRLTLSTWAKKNINDQHPEPTSEEYSKLSLKTHLLVKDVRFWFRNYYYYKKQFNPHRKETISRRRLTKCQQHILLSWVRKNFPKDHHTPTPEECARLAIKTELTRKRVKTWFQNYYYKRLNKDGRGTVRKRPRFTDLQKQILLTWVEQNTPKGHRYPTREECTELAFNTQLSEKQVKTWMNNYHSKNPVEEVPKQRFTEVQRLALHVWAEQNTGVTQTPTVEQCEKLARETELSTKQVKTWFTNYYYKKQVKQHEKVVRKKHFTESQREILRTWAEKNISDLRPIPSSKQCSKLAKNTQLSEKQVRNWMISYHYRGTGRRIKDSKHTSMHPRDISHVHNTGVCGIDPVVEEPADSSTEVESLHLNDTEGAVDHHLKSHLSRNLEEELSDTESAEETETEGSVWKGILTADMKSRSTERISDQYPSHIHGSEKARVNIENSGVLELHPNLNAKDCCHSSSLLITKECCQLTQEKELSKACDRCHRFDCQQEMCFSAKQDQLNTKTTTRTSIENFGNIKSTDVCKNTSKDINCCRKDLRMCEHKKQRTENEKIVESPENVISLCIKDSTISPLVPFKKECYMCVQKRKSLEEEVRNQFNHYLELHSLSCQNEENLMTAKNEKEGYLCEQEYANRKCSCQKQDYQKNALTICAKNRSSFIPHTLATEQYPKCNIEMKSSESKTLINQVKKCGTINDVKKLSNKEVQLVETKHEIVKEHHHEHHMHQDSENLSQIDSQNLLDLQKSHMCVCIKEHAGSSCIPVTSQQQSLQLTNELTSKADNTEHQFYENGHLSVAQVKDDCEIENATENESDDEIEILKIEHKNVKDSINWQKKNENINQQVEDQTVTSCENSVCNSCVNENKNFPCIPVKKQCSQCVTEIQSVETVSQFGHCEKTYSSVESVEEHNMIDSMMEKEADYDVQVLKVGLENNRDDIDPHLCSGNENQQLENQKLTDSKENSVTLRPQNSTVSSHILVLNQCLSNKNKMEFSESKDICCQSQDHAKTHSLPSLMDKCPSVLNETEKKPNCDIEVIEIDCEGNSKQDQQFENQKLTDSKDNFVTLCPQNSTVSSHIPVLNQCLSNKKEMEFSESKDISCQSQDHAKTHSLPSLKDKCPTVLNEMEKKPNCDIEVIEVDCERNSKQEQKTNVQMHPNVTAVIIPSYVPSMGNYEELVKKIFSAFLPENHPEKERYSATSYEEHHCINTPGTILQNSKINEREENSDDVEIVYFKNDDTENQLHKDSESNASRGQCSSTNEATASPVPNVTKRSNESEDLNDIEVIEMECDNSEGENESQWQKCFQGSEHISFQEWNSM